MRLGMPQLACLLAALACLLVATSPQVARAASAKNPNPLPAPHTKKAPPPVAAPHHRKKTKAEKPKTETTKTDTTTQQTKTRPADTQTSPSTDTTTERTHTTPATTPVKPHLPPTPPPPTGVPGAVRTSRGAHVFVTPVPRGPQVAGVLLAGSAPVDGALLSQLTATNAPPVIGLGVPGDASVDDGTSTDLLQWIAGSALVIVLLGWGVGLELRTRKQVRREVLT
jgi:hypothetical protein